MREAILLLLSFSRIFHLLLSYYKKTRVVKRFAPNYKNPYKFRYAKLFEKIYTHRYTQVHRIQSLQNICSIYFKNYRENDYVTITFD